MKKLSQYQKRKIKKKLELMGSELEKLFDNPKTELEYQNNFQLLIAILMSAQTTDKQVNKVNRNFFLALKTPRDGIDMGIDEIKEYINSISFYNNKAKNIYETCKILEKQGSIPTDLTELQKLPGVGVKTAKVYLSITQDAPYIGVDTHVHRVLNRFGIVNTKSPKQTDEVISQIDIDFSHKNLHHTMILFGRYYSKAGEDDFEKSKNPLFNKSLKEKLDIIK